MFVPTTRNDDQHGKASKVLWASAVRKTPAAICLSLLLILGSVSSYAENVKDSLKLGFVNPPESARPRIYWHWMDGNISEEGIKLDLEWMHRIGIGGVIIVDAAINTPQVVPRRLLYMTPEWKKAFRYAVETARGLGMDVTISSSPGWSETGGPWVPAAQGMKKMVWSATRIEGDKPFAGVLKHPPTVDGTFQNISVPMRKGADGQMLALPEFYADAAVVAYRIPAEDRPQAELHPQITSSGGTVNLAGLSDGDVATVAINLPAERPGSTAWVLFDYGKPQTIQAVTLATRGDEGSIFGHPYYGIFPRLESSVDGMHFTKVTDIVPSTIVERTAAFDAVTARYFRLVFETAKGRNPSRAHRITELVLSSGARVNEFEKRAGFANAPDFYAISNPTVKPEFIVKKQDVIDLTSRMSANGKLVRMPPAGEWMVLRIGYSLTGHENGPAPSEATGLEVDKLNSGYVKNYMEEYLKMYAGTVGTGEMGKDDISSLSTDSIEVGSQNWTDQMLDEFKTLRGYDARPWLPTLTGVVVGSEAETDRFLWDFRRTIAQLMAESHYGTIAEVLHAHGMKYYSEALECHRSSLGDDMEMRSRTDIPMGAMWTWVGQAGMSPASLADSRGRIVTPSLPSCTTGSAPTYMADLQGAASVAHIYGQNLVGAESMTSMGPAWSWSPNKLMKVIGFEFVLGVNRLMIHEAAHQPVSGMVPGLTLGSAGLWFSRNETWAEQAKPWITYLARSSYLLQQGKSYGDEAYFYGEEGPLTAVFGWEPAKDVPDGYSFDFVNSDAILHKFSVKNGNLVTASGMKYKILYLGGQSQRMTLPVLKQLLLLVKQGAVIVGNKPVDSPSLSDDPRQVQAVADELWGKDKPRIGTMRRVGDGKVFVGIGANEALKRLRVAADFTYTKPEPDTELMFVHRTLADGDMYFIDNRLARTETLEASFRVTGKRPELWDAATGEAHTVSYKIENGRTRVPLTLDPNGTVFVVFRKPSTKTSVEVSEPILKPIADLHEALNSDWTVKFEPNRGAPAQIQLDHLLSWSKDANEGVKYFSGTATYEKTIEIPAETLKPGMHVWLDLGEVDELAKVVINDKLVGIAWKIPYRLDVTGALRPGTNSIHIAVTNLWVNRLIGDRQRHADKRYTNTSFNPYKENSSLLPSGLLGPVEMIQSSVK